MRQNPALAVQVAAYQSDRDQLRKAYAGLADEPRADWVAQIEAAMAAPKRTVRRDVLRSQAVPPAWRWRRRLPPTFTGNDRVTGDRGRGRGGTCRHLEGRLASNDPLPSSTTRDAVLQSALGMRVRAPDLQRYGFRLTGIELFGAMGAGAAQLQYFDLGQRLLTIYVRAPDGSVQFDIVRRGDTRVCVWQDDVAGAVIIAP